MFSSNVLTGMFSAERHSPVRPYVCRFTYPVSTLGALLLLAYPTRRLFYCLVIFNPVLNVFLLRHVVYEEILEA